jgi:anti-sigma regulatory factor (Ser/Thr protein kinase)
VEQATVTFPGLPAIVPAARRFVRGVLAGTPRADDMELIVCELAANSIRHTPAGEKGGEFTVTVSTGDGWSRIEVSDAGTGQWNLLGDAAEDAEREHGRGLAIIAALASKLGHDVTPEGQTLWAEIHWADADRLGERMAAPHPAAAVGCGPVERGRQVNLLT